MELTALILSGLALVFSGAAVVYTRRQALASDRSATAAEVSAEEARKAASAAHRQASQGDRPRLTLDLDGAVGAVRRPLLVHNPGPVDVRLSIVIIDGEVELDQGGTPVPRVDVGALAAGGTARVELLNPKADDHHIVGLRLLLSTEDDQWSQGERIEIKRPPRVYVF